MHKCIGFVVSSVAVSSLAASNIFFEPSSNIIFEPASNRFFERVFEHACSSQCLDVSVFENVRKRCFEFVFSNTSFRASVFERQCFRMCLKAKVRIYVFQRQCFRAHFRRRIFEFVCLNVSVFECVRKRNFEFVFLNVSVFARIFELVCLNVGVFECFRTLVLSSQLFRAPCLNVSVFECVRKRRLEFVFLNVSDFARVFSNAFESEGSILCF